MRKNLVRILSLIVLGLPTMPVGAQAPLLQPGLAEPTPLGNPAESPPPPSVQAQASAVQHLGCADSCPCTPQGYWTAGGGLYYMRPSFGSNPAFFTSKGVIAGTPIANTQQDFSQRLDVAPLAFVGYTFANGLGIRGRWFQYSTDGQASTTLNGTQLVSPATGSLAFLTNPGPKSTVDASSNLKLSVYDLEATYVWGNEGFSLLIAGGARYATVRQNYQLNINDPAVPGVANSFSATHNFSGVGPTLALEVRKQICNSCFALYGTARGSVLFGSGNQSSTVSATDTFGDVVAVSGSGQQTLVLPIGEIELGGEVAYVWGRYRFFGQLGVIGQIWWGAGNASQGLDLSTGSAVSGGNSNNNFGLIGGVVRAGINF